VSSQTSEENLLLREDMHQGGNLIKVSKKNIDSFKT